MGPRIAYRGVPVEELYVILNNGTYNSWRRKTVKQYKSAEHAAASQASSPGRPGEVNSAVVSAAP